MKAVTNFKVINYHVEGDQKPCKSDVLLGRKLKRSDPRCTCSDGGRSGAFQLMVPRQILPIASHALYAGQDRSRGRRTKHIESSSSLE